MSLAPGSRIGPYEVAAQIGRGGMGEVYRATDKRLKRQVAIKVLPAFFGSDPDRLARFQREAEVLAALNHPNIAVLYGLEESDGINALIMELVEGPTLAERIARGALSIDDALPIAKQMADALEAAHSQNIVHRDLKPANVKVRPDGTVKVLDFGLAKALDPTSLDALADNRPSMVLTATSPALLSNSGVILGTAAYMSPEQARGTAVDKRSDLWAFGAVLFEMLTGQRAFGGQTVSDTIASVLVKEVEWNLLPGNTPAPIRRLLRRCLEKDRKRRLESAADARLEIEDALGAPTNEMHAPPAPARSGSPRTAWIAAVAGVVAAALSIPAVRYLSESSATTPPETRTDIVVPDTRDPMSFALSPDGRSIVFVAAGDGASRLWLRRLAIADAQPLAETDGAAFPFWSPDSRSVGFFADGRLKRLDIAGGSPLTLAAAPGGRGGTWNAEGVILFTPAQAASLSRVPSAGGMPTPVTSLADGQLGHRFPVFLPDGTHFIFYAQGGGDAAGIYLGSLDGANTTRLTGADFAGTYLSSGWLLWVRAGALVAQRLDLAERALAGATVTLADELIVDGDLSRAAVSTSGTSVIAYRSGGASRRQLVWFDRAGNVLRRIGAPDDSSPSNPTLSPDGRRVIVARTVQGNMDLWLFDEERASRFTFNASPDRNPVWSPDGSRIVFAANRPAPRNLYVKPVSGVTGETLLTESNQNKNPSDWSRDGRYVLYQSSDPRTTLDIWVQPTTGGGQPWAFLKTNFNEQAGRFSPDGRWVAYMSNESGRTEVYIRPFVPRASSDPDTAGRDALWQISTSGGTAPVWRPDGRELYYIGPAGEMMAAPIATVGATIEPGSAVMLFRTRIFGGADNALGRQYDVTRDGRFLINTVLDETTAPAITLIQNWTPPSGR